LALPLNAACNHQKQLNLPPVATTPKPSQNPTTSRRQQVQGRSFSAQITYIQLITSVWLQLYVPFLVAKTTQYNSKQYTTKAKAGSRHRGTVAAVLNIPIIATQHNWFRP
jgi:hypothetical protein